MSKPRLLMDAVAIIDSHKLGCWQAISKYFSIETVEECFQECLRGANQRQRHPIKQDELLATVGKPHAVDKTMRAALLQRAPGVRMDDGERDLLAYALTQEKNTYILCGPDNALVRAAVYASIEENIRSLEEIASIAGVRNISNLDEKNTIVWLSRMRTKILLEMDL